MLSRLIQPEKAPLPMEDTLEGIIMELMLLERRKAELSIKVPLVMITVFKDVGIWSLVLGVCPKI